jgi:hypothetical protein
LRVDGTGSTFGALRPVAQVTRRGIRLMVGVVGTIFMEVERGPAIVRLFAIAGLLWLTILLGTRRKISWAGHAGPTIFVRWDVCGSRSCRRRSARRGSSWRPHRHLRCRRPPFRAKDLEHEAGTRDVRRQAVCTAISMRCSWVASLVIVEDKRQRSSQARPNVTMPRRALIRQKIHRGAVDAIAQKCRRRPIRKDVAQMAAAAAAMHLRPRHAMASILGALHGAFEGIVEARPAGAAFEFFGRDEKALATSGADEGAGSLFMIQGAAAGRLRTMRAHDSILFRREKAPPLFLGMGDFKSFAWHGARPQFKPTKKASYIQIGDVQCVFLDEFAAGLDNIAHQLDENIIGVITFLDLDLQKRPRLTVERRLPCSAASGKCPFARLPSPRREDRPAPAPDVGEHEAGHTRRRKMMDNVLHQAKLALAAGTPYCQRLSSRSRSPPQSPKNRPDCGAAPSPPASDFLRQGPARPGQNFRRVPTQG